MSSEETTNLDDTTSPEGDRKIMPQKRRNIVILAGIAITILALITWVLIRNKDQKTTVQAAADSQSTAQVPTITVTTVVSQDLNREVRLPGELQAYQDVAIYPKVQSFVEWIGVDRGSVVKAGQLIARMSAPELQAQRSEAGLKTRVAESQVAESEAKIGGIRAQRLEAEARLAADEATYKRLKAASATPGVVAGNELDVAMRTVEADRARVKVYEENEKAAQAQVTALAENVRAVSEAARSVRDLESYLLIRAPFAGVITERNVDRGSLIGPNSGQATSPMLRIRQVSKLRLIVGVPEADVGGINQGEKLNFTVPAFPAQTFAGEVQRVAQSLDVKTRTMPVELDVMNASGKLSPGMYAQVIWPVKRKQPSLFVPPSAIATTTERTFVVRIRNEMTEWVDVKRGESMGNLIEVFGDLAAGDQVAIRGTDELRNGSKVIPKQPPPTP